jgi:GntR family transcriptional regulator
VFKLDGATRLTIDRVSTEEVLMASRSLSGIRRDLSMPYYEQLKDLLLEQIQRDGLKPGDLLPSEAEIGDQYGVSRTVVRQAIGDLVNDGLLYRMRGKGTFISRPKLREQFMETTAGFFEDLNAKGHRVESSVLSLGLVDAPTKVAKALNLGKGVPCIELVRLRSVNSEVVAFTKSYLGSSQRGLLEDLEAADLRRTSLYQFLEERWAIMIASAQRFVEATRADAKLARLLGVRSGDPVLYIEAVGRDATGTAIEHFEAWHRADRTRLEIDVFRQRGGATTGVSLRHP